MRRTATRRAVAVISGLLAAAGSLPARAAQEHPGDVPAHPGLRAAPAHPPLVAAAASGRLDSVAALLRGGSDPDAADRSGWTALHAAAERGDVAIARALLDGRATPDLRSRARGTALDVAERAGRAAVAELLRARGARGSGKSLGDTVCVRPWQGDGYCGTITAVESIHVELRVTRVIGCAQGCAAQAVCSAGRPVGPGGLGAADALRVPFSCLTHTGVR